MKEEHSALLAVIFICLVLIIGTVISKGHTESNCKEICESNDLEYYKYNTGIYSSDVCYCKTFDSKISTYTM